MSSASLTIRASRRRPKVASRIVAASTASAEALRRGSAKERPRPRRRAALEHRQKALRRHMQSRVPRRDISLLHNAEVVIDMDDAGRQECGMRLRLETLHAYRIEIG